MHPLKKEKFPPSYLYFISMPRPYFYEVKHAKNTNIFLFENDTIPMDSNRLNDCKLSYHPHPL